MKHKEYSLNSYVSEVYKKTSLSIGATLGISYALSLLIPISSITLPIYFGSVVLGFIGSLFSIYRLQKNSDKKTVSIYHDKKLDNDNSNYFNLFVASNTVMLTPFNILISEISKFIVPQAALITMAMMYLASHVASKLDKNDSNYKFMEQLMYKALFGSLCLSVLAMLGGMINPAISAAWFSVETVVMIPVFFGLTVFDINKIKDNFDKTGRNLYVDILGIYLNFINLFIRTAELIAKSKKK